MKGWHYALAAFALALGGFALGRYALPPSVVAREVVRVVEDTHAREQVRDLTEQVETLKRHTRKETTIVEKPDGTKETKTVEDTHVDKVVDTRTDTEHEREETKHAETVREVEKETVVERRPDWLLAPMVGYDIHTGAISYGGMIQRRILGPFSLGVWGLSTGTVGVSVGVQW